VRAAILAAALALGGCGPRPDAPTPALDSLLHEARTGKVERLRALIQADPGLARASWEGAQLGPVGAAAQAGHLEALRVLLDAGADPRERDQQTRTPLHHAANAAVASLLLERGVPPDVRASDGETPLMARAAFPDVAERLLQARARPDLRDREGLTALHRLVNTVRDEAPLGAAVLCAYGADPRIPDEKRQTAADLANRFVADGIGNHEQSRVLAAWLAPGGGCDALRARRSGGGPVPPEERAAAVHLARCDADNGWACGRAGFEHEHGQGVAVDLPRSAVLYRRSCDLGHPWGCYALGYSYREGTGLAKDPAQAARLFDQACAAGHPESCSQLAWHLMSGRGAPADAPRAAGLFTKACEGGEAWACWRLAEALAEGRGLPREPARAVELRRKACAGGEKRACGDRAAR